MCVFKDQRNAREKLMAMDSDIAPDAELDCVGLYCPMPIALTKEGIDQIEVRQVLKVEADDPAAEEDIKRWAKRTGHEILTFEKEGTMLITRKDVADELDGLPPRKMHCSNLAADAFHGAIEDYKSKRVGK